MEKQIAEELSFKDLVQTLSDKKQKLVALRGQVDSSIQAIDFTLKELKKIKVKKIKPAKVKTEKKRGRKPGSGAASKVKTKRARKADGTSIASSIKSILQDKMSATPVEIADLLIKQTGLDKKKAVNNVNSTLLYMSKRGEVSKGKNDNGRTVYSLK